MKHRLTTLLSVLVFVCAAQCPTENIEILLQSQVDEFATNWPNCTHLIGSIAVGQSPTDPVTNLNGLSNLDTIDGDLDFLESDGLQSLAGLEGLTTLNGHLKIMSNAALQNLDGLDWLTHIGGFVSIESNPSLVNIDGLEHLEAIGNYTDIISNPLLASLSGLSSLQSVGVNLRIGWNEQLPNLTGLEALQTVGGHFNITENDNLLSFDGLDNLEYIGGNIYITNNFNLQNLDAIGDLAFDGSALYITGNNYLQSCSILPVCNFIAGFDPSSESLQIFNNSWQGECSNLEEIQSTCFSILSHVSGSVFVDFECDTTFNNADIVWQNALLRKADGTPISNTNTDGGYQQLLQINSTLSYTIDAPVGYSPNPESYAITTTDSVVTYSDYHFGLCPDSLVRNMRITVASVTPPRPGFTHNIVICVENLGSVLQNGTVVFQIMDSTAGIYANIVSTNGGTINGSTVTWSFSNLVPFTEQCFWVTIQMDADASILGKILATNAQVYLENDQSDADLYDNYAETNDVVVGSFDPNDKTVDQPNVNFENTEDGLRLKYLVRFQNTGTFPATFIEVLDTIQNNLDLTTLQLLAKSHPYTLSFPKPNVLKFRFDNINLPDSTSDEPGSHGYLQFSLRTLGTLDSTDEINNRAAIYFDYNEPIITNTAITKFFVVDTRTPLQSLILLAQPNPTEGATIVQFDAKEHGITNLQILNSVGQIVTQQQFSTTVGPQSIPINLSGLPNGIYLVRLSNGQHVGSIKLVKKA